MNTKTNIHRDQEKCQTELYKTNIEILQDMFYLTNVSKALKVIFILKKLDFLLKKH